MASGKMEEGKSDGMERSASHIRGPKLMIQGLYDEANSLKFDAEPLYKLLRESKKLAPFEGRA